MAGGYFLKAEEKQIVLSIEEAERLTSGEIRVHVDEFCKGSPVLKAENLFVHMKMNETDLHNGVLIYVALKDKKFAVVGDTGIHKQLKEGYWNDVINVMTFHFQNGDIVKGICEAVSEIGNSLTIYYPIKNDDQNELSDEISYS